MHWILLYILEYTYTILYYTILIYYIIFLPDFIKWQTNARASLLIKAYIKHYNYSFRYIFSSKDIPIT